MARDMTHTSACLGTWLGVLAARKNSCSRGIMVMAGLKMLLGRVGTCARGTEQKTSLDFVETLIA